MKYFFIEPAVPGEIGENAVVDTSVHPPIVHRMHYVLDDVPDDAIFTTFPVYVVSEEAKQKLLGAGFTGITFDEIEISTSPAFELRHGRKSPGVFYWMKIEGEACRDDFGIGPKWLLVISERALEMLEQLGIPGSDIEPVEG